MHNFGNVAVANRLVLSKLVVRANVLFICLVAQSFLFRPNVRQHVTNSRSDLDETRI